MPLLAYKEKPAERLKERAFIKSYQSPPDKRPKLSSTERREKPHA